MRSKVRTSCDALLAHPECLASVDDSVILPFLKSIDATKYRKTLHSEQAQLKFPLHFSSDHQKLNFYAILHLLNFGSGFRTLLKRANGSGAFDNIIKLLISLHLGNTPLDAEWMATVDAHTVSQLMRLSMTIDVPVPDTPGLSHVKPSPVSDLVRKLTSALNTTGETLASHDAPDLLTFIQTCVAESTSIDDLLTGLSQVPTLNDTYEVYDGLHVHIFKKAQVMLSELQRRGLNLPCVGADDLTIFSDNVIPTMLQHYGLIACASADTALQNDTQITRLQSVSLRAASIVACEKIVRVARETTGFEWIGTEVDLDNYLWKVAKDPELRTLPRYSDRETWFF